MGDPSVGAADTSRVGAKSVNSASAAKGESSVHSLAPPSPAEPTLLGFGGDPIEGGKKGRRRKTGSGRDQARPR